MIIYDHNTCSKVINAACPLLGVHVPGDDRSTHMVHNNSVRCLINYIQPLIIIFIFFFHYTYVIASQSHSICVPWKKLKRVTDVSNIINIIQQIIFISSFSFLTSRNWRVGCLKIVTINYKTKETFPSTQCSSYRLSFCSEQK